MKPVVINAQDQSTRKTLCYIQLLLFMYIPSYVFSKLNADVSSRCKQISLTRLERQKERFEGSRNQSVLPVETMGTCPTSDTWDAG